MKETSTLKVYKKKRTLSDILKILSFVCFWVFLVLSVVCLVFAFKHSFGNIAEIINLIRRIALAKNYKATISIS